jgi:hypothetical protein
VSVSVAITMRLATIVIHPIIRRRRFATPRGVPGVGDSSCMVRKVPVSPIGSTCGGTLFALSARVSFRSPWLPS